jgi:hypothetical protein
MTKATKTLAGLFGILLLLSGLRYATEQGSSSKALSGPIFSVDTTQVTRIEIETKSNGTVLLEKSGQGWNVLSEDGTASYPADSKVVSGALGQLAEVQAKALLTRKVEDYPRYEVDSTGTFVRFFDGDKEKGAIILGKFQFLSQNDINTYVRPANSDEVYSVDGFLSSTFDKKANDWRNKQVWNFDRNSVIGVDFILPADSSFSMSKANSDWFARTDTLASGKVNSALNTFANLRAVGFVDDQTVAQMRDARYRFTVKMDNGSQQQLFMKPSESKKTELIAWSPSFDYVFTLNKSSISKNLLQTKQDFLKK